MASISVSGVGSGIDVNGLVKQLVAAEQQPATARLATREARYQAQISAYGHIKSALEQFRATLSPLSRASTFEAVTATSGDTSVFTARAATGATPGNYRINVDTLAQAHALVMTGVDDLNEVVGNGTLTFRFGTTDYDVETDAYDGFTVNPERAVRTLTVDASNNTLAGLRDAINAAELGVTAGIIHDGSQYRLSLTASDAGAANSLQIEVADADAVHTDASGLSRLAFNADATQLEQTVAAQNAQLSINGIAVTSAGNTITGAISGVTLDLKTASAGQAVNLEVARNTAAVGNAVRSFVTGYNQLIDTVTAASGYNAARQQGGVLMGDAAVRGISSSIRSALNQAMPGLTGAFGALAEIGVGTARDGKLVIDETRLEAALARDADAVGRLFAMSGRASSAQLRYTGAASATQAGDYTVEITRQATQGSYTGAAFVYGGSVVIDADNDDFAVRIDGVTSATLSLTQGSYTGADLAAELQTRINGDANLRGADIAVNVSFDADNSRFVMTSARYGSASSVEFTAVGTTSAATLGLSVGAGSAGQDVAGRIGGRAASGSGRTLVGTGAAEGLRVEVLGNSTGLLGTLSFARGVADRLNNLAIDLLADDSALNGRIAGITSRIDDIGAQREALGRRMITLEARLRTQFTAMDALVGQLKAVSSYLEQQLANLPTIGGS
ncbi:MAG: flagellar filament capping protein FliD [Gammaproteobacteria bacterium]